MTFTVLNIFPPWVLLPGSVPAQGDPFSTKRPETPVELRGYYPSSGRAAGGGGGGGASRSGNFFQANKPGLF